MRPSPRSRLAAVVLASTLVLVPAVSGAQEGPPGTKGKPTARLVVLFDRDTPQAEQDAAVDGAGSVLARIPELDARVLDVPGPLTRSVHRKLLADDAVRSIEVDAIREIAVDPNDPDFANGQDTLDYIGVPGAWEYTTGTSATVIAIVDTGVNGIGAELSKARFVHPRNTITNTTNVGDANGHGTKAASIAAMTGNNQTRGAGICWGCSIMPVKAMSAEGFGLASDVAEGIVWAVQHGADVINLSLGGSRSGIEKAAIDYAESQQVIVVAAAGNSSSSTPNYPAAHPSVLGVAATNPTSDNAASYSNRGPWVKLAAPGTNYAVDRNGTADADFSGTSSAAPVVTGIAALMRDENQGQSASDVRARLMSTATDVFYVSGSGGRVNAAAALAQVPGAGTSTAPTSSPGNPVSEGNATDYVAGGASTSGVITRTLHDVKAGGLVLEARCAWCGGLTLEVLSGTSVLATQAGGSQLTLSTSVPGDGTYRVRVRGAHFGIFVYRVTYTQ